MLLCLRLIIFPAIFNDTYIIIKAMTNYRARKNDKKCKHLSNVPFRKTAGALLVRKYRFHCPGNKSNFMPAQLLPTQMSSLQLDYVSSARGSMEKLERNSKYYATGTVRNEVRLDAPRWLHQADLPEKMAC
jgi:hypothetical protein